MRNKILWEKEKQRSEMCGDACGAARKGSQEKHLSTAEYKAKKIVEQARGEASGILAEADQKAERKVQIGRSTTSMWMTVFRERRLKGRALRDCLKTQSKASSIRSL